MIYFNNSEPQKNLIYSVLRTLTTKGEEEFVSTSFLVSYRDEIFLLNNRHVLDDFDTVSFEFRTSYSNTTRTKKIIFDRTSISNLLIYPDDSSDLMGVRLTNYIKRSSGIAYFAYPLAEKEILDGDLGYFERVVTLGFPKGIMDASNRIGIFRICHTATHPNIDYGNQPCFLIDGNIFPGCSGSPVFLLGDNELKKIPILLGVISCGLFVGELDTKLTLCYSMRAIRKMLDNYLQNFH